MAPALFLQSTVLTAYGTGSLNENARRNGSTKLATHARTRLWATTKTRFNYRKH